MISFAVYLGSFLARLKVTHPIEPTFLIDSFSWKYVVFARKVFQSSFVSFSSLIPFIHFIFFVPKYLYLYAHFLLSFFKARTILEHVYQIPKSPSCHFITYEYYAKIQSPPPPFSSFFFFLLHFNIFFSFNRSPRDTNLQLKPIVVKYWCYRLFDLYQIMPTSLSLAELLFDIQRVKWFFLLL